MISLLTDFLDSAMLSNVLDNLVSIFTIIGVVIAVITVKIANDNLKAVINQLKEMKLQRTHSQEPDIFVESMNLMIDYNDQDILFLAPWYYDHEEYDKGNLLPISITNIGNGVAKYVSISVNFERDFLYQLVEFDHDKVFNLRALETDYGLELFQYEYGEKYFKKSMHNYDIDNTYFHSFNYIKPQETVTFKLNENIMNIMSLGLYLTCNLYNKDKEFFPRFKIKLSYYDSFNNKYSKDIDVYIGTNNVQHNLETKKFSVNFELNGLNRLPVKEFTEA
ncbi:hypothetical protein M3589_15190 [Heyndrickxia oleronia]|uniref:hypothetical protein n=1 Tax=Heyndrickxia oleronia TaxID=38875 RepID=UPI002040B4A7|nr:hypothetical protein [Heyndrickxia oleronia]MCM3239067.1 hypothetical protein [Heyndrickxia oleronia]